MILIQIFINGKNYICNTEGQACGKNGHVQYGVKIKAG